MESKIKCDRQYPCSKCTARGKECVFNGSGRRPSISNNPIVQQKPILSATYTDSFTKSSTSPSTVFVTTPEADPTYDATTCPIPKSDEHTGSLNNEPTSHFDRLGGPEALSSSVSMPSFSKVEQFTLDVFSASASAAELYQLNAPETDTAEDTDGRVVPVNSHLSSVYASDMFGPFFSSIFNPSPSVPLSEDLSWAGLATHPDVFPFVSQVSPTGTIEAYGDNQTFEGTQEMVTFDTSATRLAVGDVQQSSTLDVDPLEPELQHYRAMQACGALFVKTRKASTFINKTLASAREALVQEFAKNPTDSSDQIHLILAVVLLQTIGLFHQLPDQRASSSIYHGMLVMMIRRTGMITKNASWEPINLSEAPLELLWQDWVAHEMTKRAIWWSYLHDCCHSIYFALPSSYHPSEIELNLPCEDALWRANTAADWITVLQTPSSYGTFKSRLTGVGMLQTLGALSETRLLEVHIPINPFSHFILIHAMLRHLFVTCVEGRLPKGDVAATVNTNDAVNQEIYRLQYALHNWLQNWLNAPELPKVNDVNEEPPFIYNALPFYWLGQVSLLAFQESLPPFEQDSPNNLKVEVRFRLVKQWLRHIRGFLKKGDQVPTLFWDELMRIRLQTWQQEFEGEEEDDQDGLLGFFPEH
ncbi:hypothetical protein C0995_013245 [Termitomyces sp. Mi166|nr:hypothetical protein C0995_013245 [Termitomyces sp. Mi166\